MNVRLEPGWKKLLAEEFSKPYFSELVGFVKREYQKKTVYPPGREIFAAFDHCPPQQCRVVIIGQDPYHGPGQAHGLCFSVNDGVPHPPSLVNIFKEIKRDLGTEPPASGNLERWAQQGVLLLNSVLTVRGSQAGSHRNRGWETFTDAAVRQLATRRDHLVFLLWGSYAQRKGEVVDRSRHLVLESPHPSPLSAHRGFFGNGHFSRANEYLAQHGQPPVRW